MIFVTQLKVITDFFTKNIYAHAYCYIQRDYFWKVT